MSSDHFLFILVSRRKTAEKKALVSSQQCLFCSGAISYVKSESIKVEWTQWTEECSRRGGKTSCKTNWCPTCFGLHLIFFRGREVKNGMKSMRIGIRKWKAKWPVLKGQQISQGQEMNFKQTYKVVFLSTFESC